MAGCHNSLDGAIRRLSCFNPHPARWLDATCRSTCCYSRLHLVSILTQPEGRMPLVVPSAKPYSCTLFQPSPCPKAGCHTTTSLPSNRFRRFNPHPARWPDATLLGAERPLVLSEEQNTMKYTVSILTQPEGWMPVPHQAKHHVCFNPHPALCKVPTSPGAYPSILVSVTPSGIAASSTMTL
jgi:hypothetical protein